MSSLLKKNLAVLRKANSVLADQLKGFVPDEEKLALVPAKDGRYSLRLSGAEQGSGQVYLHSRYRPWQEAQKQIAPYLKDDGRVGHEDDFIFMGFGLGYHFLALAENFCGVNQCVIIEPDLAAFYYALTVNDFSSWLAPDRSMILVGLTAGEVAAQFIKVAPTMAMNKIRFVEHGICVQQYRDYFQGIREALQQGITYATKSLQTSMVLTGHDVENRLGNLAGYVNLPRLAQFKNKFSGKTGILVAAGPSLQKNIRDLREVGNRAVIFTVGTAARCLLQEGIVPDFIASLDYSPVSQKYLEDLPLPKDGQRQPILLADPKCYPGHPRAYDGPTIYLSEERMEWLLGNVAFDQGATIHSGATVAHMAFSALEFFGVKEIITCGLDLSFSFGVTHIPGIATYKGWFPSVNRFHSYEMLEWEQIVRFRKEMIKLEDVFGDEVYSDGQLVTYYQAFCQAFMRRPRPVIDATQGGCRKENTKIMSLVQAIKDYCIEPIDDTCFESCQGLELSEGQRVSAKEFIEKRLDEIKLLVDHYTKAKTVIDDISTALDDTCDLQAGLQSLKQVQQKIAGYQSLIHLVRFFTASDEIQTRRADRRLMALKGGWDEKTKLREQLKRDRDVMCAHEGGLAKIASLMEAHLLKSEGSK